MPQRFLTILLVDDDADDCLVMQEAFVESGIVGELHVLEENGDALMDYLYQRGRYSAPGQAPRPDVILLDLKLPGRSGLEILQEIKEEPRLRRIPVVMLSTSKAMENVVRAYGLGANSYIAKPERFAGFVDTIKGLGAYWGDLVELPPGREDD